MAVGSFKMCFFDVILNPDSCLFKLQLKVEKVKPTSFF